MDCPLKLLSLSKAIGILLLPGSTLALWGFGKGNSNSEVESSKRRVIDDLRAKIALDEFIPPAVGVGRKDAEKYAAAWTAGELRCGASIVKWEMVNDEFCDCEDGSDEPGTSACVNGIFECANHGYIPLSLPSSRVGDGLCDCCDGSDEMDGKCDVTCGDASVTWMEKLADRVVKIEQGNVKRVEYVKQAAEAASNREHDVSETTKALDKARQELATAEEQLEVLEAEESKQRDIQLGEAEGLVRSKLDHLSPDRMAALAVAVASAEDSSAVLDTIVDEVTKGVDVADVLKNLSTDRRKDTKRKPPSKPGDDGEEGEPPPPQEDDVDDHPDLDDLGVMDNEYDYEATHMDGYYGGYEGYGDYGDWDGFLDDDYVVTNDDEADNAVDTVYDKEATPQIPVPASDSDGSSSSHPAAGREENSGDRSGEDSGAQEGEHGKARDKVEEEEDHAYEEPFVTPREFKSLKYETPEAVKSRKRVKELENAVKAKSRELKALEDEASAYYGADNALGALKDRCLTHNAGGYVYRVCFFKDAHQEESKSKTLIGKWKGVEGSMELLSQEGSNHLLNGEVVVFDRGQKCWNGPSRSLRVALACGREDALVEVAEPETCAYTAVLETPAACSLGLIDALLGKGSNERSKAADGSFRGEHGDDIGDVEDCRKSGEEADAAGPKLDRQGFEEL